MSNKAQGGYDFGGGGGGGDAAADRSPVSTYDTTMEDDPFERLIEGADRDLTLSRKKASEASARDGDMHGAHSNVAGIKAAVTKAQGKAEAANVAIEAAIQTLEEIMIML